jgi:signal transduction histidine kinase
MRILAVDDDAVVRMSMRGMVVALGHECLLAENGLQAWQTLQDESIDVVITDRMMPDLDGLELCRRIREATPETDYVYVVLATALGTDAEARDGMVAGADDYLVKPVRKTELERKLIAAERVTALHRQLALTQDRLAEANRIQADMIAMLGHDARQPLTAVIGYSEANLEDWEISPVSAKRALVVKTAVAARRLNQLIEDVLTMANLDSGTLMCRAESFAPDTLIAEVIAAAGEEGAVTVSGDLTAHTTMDPWHFRQIVTNLVGNAQKYGAPPIAVTVHPAAGRMRIAISDQGEGVPTGFVPHLFERFTRADTGIATRKQGTGFGLYIVQRLAEANDGSISYTPGATGGSCFTLDVPAGGAARVA